MTARNQFPDGEARAARQARIAAADRQWARDAARLASLVLAPFGTVGRAPRRVRGRWRAGGVPFAALPVTARGGTLDLRALRAGLAARVVRAWWRADGSRTLPSASMLAVNCGTARGSADTPAAVRALVLADPVFRADDPRA